VSPVHGAGQICSWDGGSIWIGRATAANDFHAHHAVQVALALDGRFRFSSPADGVWLDCTGAVIASHRPHAFDGRNATLLAHIFVEPESVPGRALLRRFTGPHGICVLSGPVLDMPAHALAEGHRADPSPGNLVATARAVLRTLTEGGELPEPMDPRILRVVDYLRGNLDRNISLEQVATVVHLSASHLRHLFVREMGLAFRPYLLWLRLNRAVEAYAGGESLTAAAHGAGFADSAHLSRTFRRMYGMAAGTLRLE
jgi:AraC-like DNA-binding protein